MAPWQRLASRGGRLLLHVVSAACLASTTPQCVLPEQVPRGFDVSGCPARGGTALAQDQCQVVCDFRRWFVGTATVACADGNSTQPGTFVLSGCRRLACPAQCGAWCDVAHGSTTSEFSGLAYDRQTGRAYVSDSARNVVLAVGTVGAGDSFETIWSGLSNPHGLALNTLGRVLYVADTGNSRIQALDLSAASASATTVSSGLAGPRALAMNEGSDDLFVAEYISGRVKRITFQGGNIRVAAAVAVVSSGLANPTGLAVNTLQASDGLHKETFLFVSEGSGLTARVTRISLSTARSRVVAGAASDGGGGSGPQAVEHRESKLSAPVGLAAWSLDDAPVLFIADSAHNQLYAAELLFSEASCKELGWETDMDVLGSHRVCGRSRANKDLVPHLCASSAPPGLCCSGLVNFSQAAAFCRSQGARLCSAFELEADDAKDGHTSSSCKTGSSWYDDFYDEALIWTSTPCLAQRYGHDGYFVRSGAREWATHTPAQCARVNDTAGYVKCCADGGLVAPVAGATAPDESQTASSRGVRALYHSVQLGSKAGLAMDPVRKRLLIASGSSLSSISWASLRMVVAGTSSQGHTGDSVAAYTTALNSPLGLAWAKVTGKLLIADRYNNAVRSVEVGKGMEIEPVAGSGEPRDGGDGNPAAEAHIWEPTGIAMDPAGTALFISTESSRVRKVDLATGLVSTLVNVAGVEGQRGDLAPAGLAELHAPRGLTVSASGGTQRLFIADRDNHRVRVVDLSTGMISTIAGPVFVAPSVTRSRGIVKIYTLQVDRRTSSVGMPVDLMTAAPAGVAASASGELVYISDEHSQTILRMERVRTDGAWQRSSVMPVRGSPVTTPLLPLDPQALLLRSDGTLLVADRQRHGIYAIEVVCSVQMGCQAGSVRLVAGDPDGAAGDDEDHDLRRRWTTTTSTTTTTTTSVTTVTTTLLPCVGYLLGEGGETCNEACIAHNGTCDPTIAAGFTYEQFRWAVLLDAGYPCERDARSWWGDFMPAFDIDETSRNHGWCMGTWNMPTRISCDGYHNIYNQRSTTLRRWCKCRRDEACNTTTTTSTVGEVEGPSTSPEAAEGTTPSPFFEPCPAGYRISQNAVSSSSGHRSTMQTSVANCGVVCEVHTPCAAFTFDGEHNVCHLHDTVQLQSDSTSRRHDTVCIRSVDRATSPDLLLEVQMIDWLPATSRLREPTGMVLDEARRLLYFCDAGNDKVKVVDLDTDQMIAVAGVGPDQTHYSGDGGPARDAALWNPRGLALDHAAGYLYIADTNNHVIRRVALGQSRLTGVIATVVGSNIAGWFGDGYPPRLARLRYPQGVALDAAGPKLYITDTSNHKIRSYDFNTNRVQHVAGDDDAISSGDGGSGLGAQITSPREMMIINTGTTKELFFTEFENQRLRQLDLTYGIIDTALQTYAVNLSAGDGLIGIVPRDYDADVAFPYGIAVAHVGTQGAGTAYVASYLHHRVRKVDLATGLASTLAGRRGERGGSGDGGPATAALLDGPTDVALDRGADVLYVAEGDAGRVRKIDLSDGTISTIATVPGQYVYGLAIDEAAQNIYVSSPSQHVVYQLTLGVAACTAPTGVADAMDPVCREGSEVDVAVCTPRCTAGYRPSESRLWCYDGVLTPATFECVPEPCAAPALVEYARRPSCVEGRWVPSGGSCTAVCRTGYVADANLTCLAGTFTPPEFVCAFAALPTAAPTLPTSGGFGGSPGAASVNGPTPAPGSEATASAAGVQIEEIAIDWGIALDVNGSVRFDAAVPGLDLEETSLLSATDVVRGPLQRALAEILLVSATSIIIKTVSVTRARRLSTRSLGRNLQVAWLHRISAGYIVFRPPVWAIPRVRELESEGAQTTTTFGAFVQALDRQGFSQALEKANQNRGKLCSMLLGVAGAPVVPCKESPDATLSGARCTPNCLSPLVASEDDLVCFAGFWSPPRFRCIAAAAKMRECAAPEGIAGLATPACSELLPGGTGHLQKRCSPLCTGALVPTQPELLCLDGTWSPSQVRCVEVTCHAPAGIPHAGEPLSCEEGLEFGYGAVCTSVCKTGFKATAPYLSCERGGWSPSAFQCVPADVLDPAQFWSQHSTGCDTASDGCATSTTGAPIVSSSDDSSNSENELGDGAALDSSADGLQGGLSTTTMIVAPSVAVVLAVLACIFLTVVWLKRRRMRLGKVKSARSVGTASVKADRCAHAKQDQPEDYASTSAIAGWTSHLQIKATASTQLDEHETDRQETPVCCATRESDGDQAFAAVDIGSGVESQSEDAAQPTSAGLDEELAATTSDASWQTDCHDLFQIAKVVAESARRDAARDAKFDEMDCELDTAVEAAPLGGPPQSSKSLRQVNGDCTDALSVASRADDAWLRSPPGGCSSLPSASATRSPPSVRSQWSEGGGGGLGQGSCATRKASSKSSRKR